MVNRRETPRTPPTVWGEDTRELHNALEPILTFLRRITLGTLLTLCGIVVTISAGWATAMADIRSNATAIAELEARSDARIARIEQRRDKEFDELKAELRAINAKLK